MIKIAPTTDIRLSSVNRPSNPPIETQNINIEVGAITINNPMIMNMIGINCDNDFI